MAEGKGRNTEGSESVQLSVSYWANGTGMGTERLRQSDCRTSFESDAVILVLLWPQHAIAGSLKAINLSK